MSTQTLHQGSLRPIRVPAIRGRYKISSALLGNLLRRLMPVRNRSDQVVWPQRRTVVHPGLQVHSIAAPKTDRRLSLLMSVNLYCAFAAGAVMVAQASPAIKNALIQTKRPPVVVELRPPIENIRPIPVVAPTLPINLQFNPSNTPIITEPQPIGVPDTPTTIGNNDVSERIASNPYPGTVTGTNPVPGTSPGVGDIGPAISQPMDVSFRSVSILRQIQPIYPSLARVAHKEGDVVLIMTINEQGVPTDVKVDSGDSIFRNDAVHAAQQWRFTPANLDGQPHSARFRLTLQFRLRG